MKHLTLLLFLITMSCLGQTNYTTYDCNTFDVGYSSTVIPTSGCYTTVTKTFYTCIGRFNPVTNQWYEAATPQQLEECLMIKEVENTQPDAIAGMNNLFTTIKTDTQLNVYYGGMQPPFTLYCPNTPYPNFTSGFVAYVKITANKWKRLLCTDNQP